MKPNVSARLALVCILALAAGLLAACSADSASSPTGTTGATISEQNYAFIPAGANVMSGDSVVFVNDDTVAHNVKINGGELGVQKPGESKTWIAPSDGSYPYSCTIHPSMTGQIIVGAGSTNGPVGAPSGNYTPPSGGSGGY
jgi:plastocyanin